MGAQQAHAALWVGAETKQYQCIPLQGLLIWGWDTAQPHMETLGNRDEGRSRAQAQAEPAVLISPSCYGYYLQVNWPRGQYTALKGLSMGHSFRAHPCREAGQSQDCEKWGLANSGPGRAALCTSHTMGVEHAEPEYSWCSEAPRNQVTSPLHSGTARQRGTEAQQQHPANCFIPSLPPHLLEQLNYFRTRVQPLGCCAARLFRERHIYRAQETAQFIPPHPHPSRPQAFNTEGKNADCTLLVS